MKHASASLGPDFSPFLYASVGEQGNGMPLSVLSTIARRNLDPWQESTELAALPVELAKKRLASMIAALPGMAPRFDAGDTTDRLIGLLPQRTRDDVSNLATPLDNQGLTKSALIWMVTMALILGVQVLAASRQSPGQGAIAPASTASTTLEPKPLVGLN